MTRQDLIKEIEGIAAKAEEAKEPYIAEGLLYFTRLIRENVEGTFISLLAIMNKHFK